VLATGSVYLVGELLAAIAAEAGAPVAGRGSSAG